MGTGPRFRAKNRSSGCISAIRDRAFKEAFFAVTGSADAHSPLVGMTVMLIEEEFLVALDLQRLVEQAGAASVLPVSSLDAVDEMAKYAGRVDLALIGVKLDPDAGLALIDRLKAAGVRYVLISGTDRKPDRDGVILLPKPFSDSEFLSAVKGLLGCRA